MSDELDGDGIGGAVLEILTGNALRLLVSHTRKDNQDDFQNPEYKRIESLGWNYRLSEFSSAIALAQLENLDRNIEYRTEATELFLDAIKNTNCDYLVPQKTPKNCKHTWWTVPILYNGEESIGVSWKDFRAEYVKQGGDGIYGACSVQYLEPMVSERRFVKRLPQVYENVKYEKGICPVSEDVQSKLMQFKNNYRSLELAKIKAKALEKTIIKFRRK